MPRELIDVAMESLINENAVLFHHGLHEQTLVGRLAYHLQKTASSDEVFGEYYADVEYNRAVCGTKKRRTDNNNENQIGINEIARVFVDLVLHGRGLNGNRENIICCEMKKRIRKTRWENIEQAVEDIFNENSVNTASIKEDQEKIKEFTSLGDAFNLNGDVIGYELGVLIVPRYNQDGICEHYENQNVDPITLRLTSRINQIFVRYYVGGDILENGDRIIRVPPPMPPEGYNARYPGE